MVTVQYYKYPDTPHWRHDMIRLGEDHHGVWLGAPTGSILQRGQEEPIVWESPFVQLIPPGRWWTAIFNAGGRIHTYVDIITVAAWATPDRVEMVDLDLDVIRLADGTIYVDDEDEFDLNRVDLGYPPRMVASARTAAARVTIDLETRTPPFDGSARPWLERLT